MKRKHCAGFIEPEALEVGCFAVLAVGFIIIIILAVIYSPHEADPETLSGRVTGRTSEVGHENDRYYLLIEGTPYRVTLGEWLQYRTGDNYPDPELHPAEQP